MSFFRVVLAALILSIASASASAAEVRIDDIKARLFLEQAGKLSDDILSGAPIADAPKGGLARGETATSVLIDFTFSGDKNAAPKYASATVDLTQTGPGGQQVVTHKAFTGFRFGPDGLEHKAVFLEGAACMPLAIDVRAGKTHKTAKIDFSCAQTQTQ